MGPSLLVEDCAVLRAEDEALRRLGVESQRHPAVILQPDELVLSGETVLAAGHGTDETAEDEVDLALTSSASGVLGAAEPRGDALHVCADGVIG